MKVIQEKTVKLKKVLTKSGVELYMIELSPDHFFIEQNYKKPSRYGIAYRKLKEKYPDFFMFWEIKDDRYTGRILMGTFAQKEEIDEFITSVLKEDDYKEYPVEREEIE